MPASRTVFPPSAFAPGATALTFVGAIVLLFAVFVIGAVAWVVVHGADIVALQRSIGSLFGIALQSAAEVIVVIYLAITVPAIAKTRLHDLGFRAPSAQTVTATIAAVASMFVVVTLLGSLLTTVFHVHQQEIAVQLFMRMQGWQKAAFALFAVVVGPVAEEFFFRIFLFNAMRKWWSFWPAAIVSGVLFGLAHAQPGGGPALLLALSLPLAVGGVILAYVYARTGNAWANMTTHASFNALSLLLITIAPHLAK